MLFAASSRLFSPTLTVPTTGSVILPSGPTMCVSGELRTASDGHDDIVACAEEIFLVRVGLRVFDPRGMALQSRFQRCWLAYGRCRGRTLSVCGVALEGRRKRDKKSCGENPCKAWDTGADVGMGKHNHELSCELFTVVAARRSCGVTSVEPSRVVRTQVAPLLDA